MHFLDECNTKMGHAAKEAVDDTQSCREAPTYSRKRRKGGEGPGEQGKGVKAVKALAK